jgi:hypothetical protein
MSISFDTNSCSGVTHEESKPRGNQRPFWWLKACPNCGATHGNGKRKCECGHIFVRKGKPGPVVKTIKSPSEMLREVSPKTVVLPKPSASPTIPPITPPKTQKSRASLIHARLANYYGLIAAAHKELSEIL